MPERLATQVYQRYFLGFHLDPSFQLKVALSQKFGPRFDLELLWYLSHPIRLPSRAILNFFAQLLHFGS